MKEYLKSIVNQLKNYSDTLDRTSILIDKPWALIDEEFEMQKLIFKKDKQLILSKNGQVQIGKWDYLPQAKSLLIDRNTDKILCNEAFIDEGVMILKLDGTTDRFFILANENMIPDLNAMEYLKKLKNQKLFIEEKILYDGRILEIHRLNGFHLNIGETVTIDSENVEDGMYQLNTKKHFYDIKGGKIKKIITETKYTNPDDQEIIIQQQLNWDISYGDCVFMYGKQLDSAIINFNKHQNLIVRDGKVVRLERKNPVARAISKFFKKVFMVYCD